ncbi:MAG: MaoC family dehydratase [Sinobacteraceae bacterium]|nr:MaoC family dehydratase [Nevskiaceae bacterium]
MSGRYWEDIELGAMQVLGQYTFTQEEIMRFARAYDPQPFHIDPEAAARSFYGGLIASGWHTVAVWMKLAVAGHIGATRDGPRSGVSPGFEDLRWLKPVRPGMTLTYSSEVIEKVALKSRPRFGLVKSRNEARAEDGSLMMRFTGKGFVERRSAGNRE